jgi:DNA-binding transcriptional MerR regulator
MNELIQKQFTTGQFADMHGVNKRTLMYYDSIGLLKPAVVKENGYRYYTLRQALVFDAILLLRELRVPLKEIKCLSSKLQSFCGCKESSVIKLL